MAHILLVEDDEDCAALAEYRLTKDGHRVSVATSGSAALLLLSAADPFDLALLDVQMPGDMDGVALLRRLRAHRFCAEMPVIMMTAQRRDADIERAFSAGADEYLTKPYSPRELSARVLALLTRPEHSAASALAAAVPGRQECRPGVGAGYRSR